MIHDTEESALHQTIVRILWKKNIFKEFTGDKFFYFTNPNVLGPGMSIEYFDVNIFGLMHALSVVECV